MVNEIQPRVDQIKPSVDEIQPSGDEIQPSVDEILPRVEEIQGEWKRSRESGRDLAEFLERLTANANVATVMDSTPTPSDTVESLRQMKQC